MTKQTKLQYVNALESRLPCGGGLSPEKVEGISVWRMCAAWDPFVEVGVEVQDLYHIYLEYSPGKKKWVGWSPEDGGAEFYASIQEAWDSLTEFGAYLLYP
jgi:hypothetical protein